ncbi:hypothetical protein BGC30_03125 [Novacetimonas hansenii]|nr:hypothetical protein BGC30_03125 [Novacetimonas hansenii]
MEISTTGNFWYFAGCQFAYLQVILIFLCKNIATKDVIIQTEHPAQYDVFAKFSIIERRLLFIIFKYNKNKLKNYLFFEECIYSEILLRGCLLVR